MALFSSLPNSPRPHGPGGGALPGELGLFADTRLGSDQGRQGQDYQTSAFSTSREPCWGLLLAFAEVWPPSRGISH